MAEEEVRDLMSKGNEYLHSEDYASAAECFGKAAELGDSEAQYFAGKMCENGLGVDQDIVRAAEFYEKAAENGNPKAQAELAEYYQTNEGTEEESEKAFRWSEAAYRQGMGDATYWLALCYLYGRGTDSDFDRGMELLKEAVDTEPSDPDTCADDFRYRAPLEIARIYDFGELTDVDGEKAREWYALAAERGSEEAENRLLDL